MERRGGAGRLAALATTFRQATRLEAAFWQMGLAAG
jgi:thiaminase/transcriptional activator TenA